MPLQELRQQIDAIDDQLLDLLAQRRHIAQRIGTYKSQQHQAVQDPAREQALLARLTQRGATLALDRDYIQHLYAIILRDSIASQESLKVKQTNIP